MDTYKLKFTRLQNEIFRFLCMNAGKNFNKREISKKLNVSPTAIAKSLILLENEKLITLEREGNINLTNVSFNRDFQKTINLKRVENLKIIYESNICDFLEENFPGTTIILFGSYSDGEDIISSDIDIAIIGTKGKELNLTKFQKIFKKELNLSFYENWKGIDKGLRENIINGTVLIGGIEL